MYRSKAGVRLSRSYLFIPGLRANGEVRPLLALGWTLNYEMFFYVFFACCLLFPLKRGLLLLTAFFICFCCGRRAVQDANDGAGLLERQHHLRISVRRCHCLDVSRRLCVSPPSRRLRSSCLALAWPLVSARLWGVEDVLPRFMAAGIPAALIVFAAACGPRLPATWFVAPLVLIGDASYSLYLSHPFVIRPLRNLWLALPVQMPIWTYVVACCVAAILGAIALY